MMSEQLRTAEEAAQLVNALGSYLAVQVEICPLRWMIVRRDGRFKSVVSATELLEFGLALTRCVDHGGVLESGCSPAFLVAVQRLRAKGIEVIVTDGGMILHGVSAQHGLELTCDSEAEVIAYAVSVTPALSVAQPGRGGP